MNKVLFAFLVFFTLQASHAQSFHPAAGQTGSNAIYRDSSCFVSWASGGSILRGYVDINDTTILASGSNKASYGSIDLAFGLAEGDGSSVVSLGDNGSATLTFDRFITDGPGYDFAVFENSFTDNYMELAHVEVSSDGSHFVRFPSTSEIPTDQQLTNFSYSDCRMVNNLAGKYRAGFGTPFDLSELPDDPNLDKSAITHVRIVDVIGAVSGTHTSVDANGNTINDPYTTPYASCGFDLDGVGVINGTLQVPETTFAALQLYPNPATDLIRINLPGTGFLTLQSPDGKIVLESHHHNETILSITHLTAGVYSLSLQQNNYLIVKQVIIH